MTPSRSGVIRAYDSPRGVGTVEEIDGAEFAFQCTQLADGSREINVGDAVSFDVVPGGPGRWEAANLVLRTASGSLTHPI